MKNRVLFLGAGASRGFGYALTSEILPEVIRRVRTGGFRSRALKTSRAKAALTRALKALHPGLTHLDQIPQVTDVLSLLDHCIIEGQQFDSGVELREARELLDLAIVDVIDAPIHACGPLKPRDFVKWLLARDRRDGMRTTVVSTNYDLSVDLPLLREALDDFDEEYRGIDFGMTWRTVDDGEVVPPPNEPTLGLYKLHGSLNWLKCTRCGHIYVNLSTSLAAWGQADGEGNECHCGHRPLHSVLVAPSFARAVREPQLLAMWQRAGELLRTAREWMFVGYSLPSEDIAIRSMLLRAWHGHEDRKKLAIQAINPSGDALKRYSVLFPDVETLQTSLEGYVAAAKG